MPGWLVWLIAAGVLGVGELLSLGLVLGMVAVAAVVAAGVAALGGGVVVQVLAFGASSAALLAGLRPVARRHLRSPAQLRTGAEALVGARGVVLERVDAHTGRAKINGEVWSARAYQDGLVIEPGARVDVLRIDGATAVVYEAEV